MTSPLVNLIYNPSVKSEIDNIFNENFIDFKRSKIRLPEDTYYFLKVSSKSIIFASLTYNMFCEKGYIQPIALIYQNFEIIFFPTLIDYKDFFNRDSRYKINKLDEKESLVSIMGSLEIINMLYENKQLLMQGKTLTCEVNQIKFTISDLFNSSFHFHTNNGEIHVGSYDYSIERVTHHLVLENLNFNNEFKLIQNRVQENKFLVFSNEVKIN